jgi:Pyruvate/2-oxoacid:ferredoxin oxidoreductase delta subunit
VGSCPAGALALPSFERDKFLKSFIASSSDVLSCEEMGVCLNIFSSADLLSMGLGKNSNVSCDMSRCGNCSINDEVKISALIKENVDQANEVLALLKEPKRIELKEEIVQPQRRDFLRKIGQVVTTKPAVDVHAQGEVRAALVDAKSAANPPESLIFLRSLLKERIEDFSSTLLSTQKGFLSSQVIDSHACTNCQECIKSCPTRALTSSNDHEMILFQQGSCIACGVCHEVCPEKCITSSEEVDLVDIAFNRAQKLATFQIAICQECKAGFVYKGGEQVCSRCLTYRDDFAHMFVSADGMA